MSDMKCPFCQQKIMCMDAQDADEHSTWYCPRCIAERAWYAFGNETLWQELIRTRKVLDVAMDGLKRIEKLTEPSYKNRNLEALALAVNTFSGEIIKQITTLEQKETK